MPEQEVAPTAASADTVIFVEGGRLHAAKLHSSSPRRVRIIDASGGKRKLELAKVVASGIDADPASFIARATAVADDIDMEEVWRLAAGRTLGIGELAARLASQEEPAIVRAALQLAHASERAFFVQDGARLAPVAAATHAKICAARAKRQAQARLEADYDRKLAAGSLPPELAALLKRHLAGGSIAQDPVGRYLRRYCKLHAIEPAQLALDYKLVASPAEILLAQVRSNIPKARRIDDFAPQAAKLDQIAGAGYALDSADTSEVDDAFACSDAHEVSVAIAAPSLGLPAAALQQAEQRMVSVYLPGKKYPMLPEQAVAAYTLRAPARCPVVALRHRWDGGAKPGGRAFVLGELGMRANLAVELFDSELGHPQLDEAGADARALASLRRFASTVAGPEAREEGGRGHLVKLVDGEPRIHERADFAAADDLVASLMVHYNRCAAAFLRERGYPFIARHEGRCVVVGSEGKVVADYGWFSSPLRRLVDLYNQQQLVAAIAERPPPHSATELRRFLPAFERRHQWAKQMQQRLETYWSMVWLQRQPAQSWRATALAAPGRVRLKRLPLLAQLDGATLEAGSACEVELTSLDLLQGRASARLA